MRNGGPERPYTQTPKSPIYVHISRRQLGPKFGRILLFRKLANVSLAAAVFWRAYLSIKHSRRQLTPNFGRIFGPRAWATL